MLPHRVGRGREQTLAARALEHAQFVLRRANGQILIEDGARRLLPTTPAVSDGAPLVIECQAHWPIVLIASEQ